MNTPVIKVNGQPLTRFELTNAMQEYALQMHDTSFDELDEEQREAIFHTTIEKLVVWELIYQKSMADGVEVDDKIVETELDGIAEQFDDREAMVEELEKANVSMELLHRSVRREILVDDVLNGRFAEAPEPTAEDFDAGYQEYLKGRDEAIADGTHPDPGEALSRDEAKDMIIGHLRNKAATETVRTWVNELREEAEIEYLEEL